MSYDEFLFEEFHHFINSDEFYQMIEELNYPTC